MNIILGFRDRGTWLGRRTWSRKSWERRRRWWRRRWSPSLRRWSPSIEREWTGPGTPYCWWGLRQFPVHEAAEMLVFPRWHPQRTVCVLESESNEFFIEKLSHFRHFFKFLNSFINSSLNHLKRFRILTQKMKIFDLKTPKSKLLTNL